MKLKHIIIAVMATLVTACGNTPRNEKNDTREPQIFPDYCGVTVPVGIAPTASTSPSAGRKAEHSTPTPEAWIWT